jgi:hypothetical protein
MFEVENDLGEFMEDELWDDSAKNQRDQAREAYKH